MTSRYNQDRHRQRSYERDVARKKPRYSTSYDRKDEGEFHRYNSAFTSYDRDDQIVHRDNTSYYWDDKRQMHRHITSYDWDDKGQRHRYNKYDRDDKGQMHRYDKYDRDDEGQMHRDNTSYDWDDKGESIRYYDTSYNKTERANAAAALELYGVVFNSGGLLELREALCKLSKRNEETILTFGAENFIRVSFSDIFELMRAADGRYNVKVIMPLKFCPQAAEKDGCPDGFTCDKLHLCPYFVKGNCTYKDKCWMSHQIKDLHILSMLREIGLADVDEALWLQILKKVLVDTEMERGASSHDVPEICKFYNNLGGCGKGEKCAFLHVCQHFVDDTCKFGDDCKREHDLLKHHHNRKVFREFGLRNVGTSQLLSILQGRLRKIKSNTNTSALGTGSNEKNTPVHKADFIPLFVPEAKNIKFTDTTQVTSSTGSEGKDICVYHVRGQCNYGQKCVNLHKELPYQWQLQDVLNLADSGWKDLFEDWNMMLERAYCDPSTNEIVFYHQGQSFKTDFDKMTAAAEESQACPPLKLRRLSTESSAEAPPGHIFSTRWKWYWQDERNQWQCYDSPDDGFKPNTTCSNSLEKDYLQGQDNHSFNAGHSSYNLYYKKMSQKNVKSQTERAVRRRPEFVAKEKKKEIAKKRKEAAKSAALQASGSSCTSDITSFPSHWDSMVDKTGYVLNRLDSTSQEYTNTEKEFLKTMPPKTYVERIERIQNPDLWTAFVQKKERITKKANNAPPKEMPRLFHGTSAGTVNAICQQGFDWRMCGKHGTAYGQGSYFARDARYSHRYTDRTSLGDRQMFVARVLVGSYVLGNSSLTRPPPRDQSKPHGDLHDSCVDSFLNPSIYVVFDNNQCYPEHLITYRN